MPTLTITPPPGRVVTTSKPFDLVKGFNDMPSFEAYVPANTVTGFDRMSRKRGRFSVDFETNEIDDALRGYQATSGDTVDYYRFDPGASVMDTLYDEAVGSGRVYVGPISLQVLHVQHFDGAREDQEGGFYYEDTIHATLTYATYTKTGIVQADVEHQHYLRDRLVYDSKVFRVNKIEILGQIQRRDLIISLDGDQVRSDELTDDPQFARFSA